jgi:predicted nucleotidyltransferase
MHFDLDSRTILLVRHGSHAYGLNTATSDLDVKGVCIKPADCYFGFLKRFEQAELMVSKGHEQDRVVYSLDKFAALAADCNPNIIEVLHVDDSDVLKCDPYGERLRAMRDAFLSKKAKFTFSGYAYAQLKRIKTHRAWLLNPPKTPPTRAECGLPDGMKVSSSELGSFESLLAKGVELEMPKDVMTLFVRERAYQSALTHWKQYENWKATRNAARSALEAAHGYDTKHGMHLLRLMRMCRELMTTGKVVVRRPDRDELLAVRGGQRSYDSLIEEAERLQAECDALYQTSDVLPREPDRTAIDAEIVEMTQEYLFAHNGAF